MLISVVFLYSYRVSIKYVSIPYISQMAQNYEEPRNTCSIISRSYSFKGVGRNLSPQGNGLDLNSKILNELFPPFPYCSISFKKA